MAKHVALKRLLADLKEVGCHQDLSATTLAGHAAATNALARLFESVLRVERLGGQYTACRVAPSHTGLPPSFRHSPASKQVLEHPQPDTVARPLDSNLFIWHANLRLPEAEAAEAAATRSATLPVTQCLAGVPLHVVLLFPETYPTDGPEVRLFHALPHPNVFPHLAPRE